MERKDWQLLIAFSLIIAVFFFLPIEVWVQNVEAEGSEEALIEGLLLINTYVTQHLFTSILPAMFIAGGIVAFVRRESILKYLGHSAKKIISYPIASIAGGFLTVCSCTILPLFAGIRKRGAGLGPATTFLFAGPAINVAAIFLTMSILGFEIGLARVIFAIILSLLVGLTMAFIFREKSEKGELFMEQSNVSKISMSVLILFFGLMVLFIIINGIPTNDLPIKEVHKYFIMFIVLLALILLVYLNFPREETKKWLEETWVLSKGILPLLFVGIFIAGFIIPILPPEIIKNLVGENTVFANFIASIFGAVMYFSTMTEIPILEMLMEFGMAKGPALALLLGGPSVSLPNLLIVRQVLGNKKTLVYISLVVFYSTLAGFIYGMT